MMKRVLASMALLSVASFAHADFLPQSTDLCQGVTCTAKMTEINKAFNGSVSFTPQAEKGVVYSGACYHIGTQMDPEHEHHGLAIFQRGDDQVVNYSGVFSFFATQDPYKDLDLAGAVKYATSAGSKLHPVTLETTKGRVELPYDTGKITYWFRTNESGSELYLLSRWAFQEGEQRSFCRLQRH